MIVFTLSHLSQPVCFRTQAVTACAGAGIRCKENGPFPDAAGAQAALASSHCHRPAVPGTQTQAGMSALASQSLSS